MRITQIMSRALLPMLGLALALTACGGGDDSGSAEGTVEAPGDDQGGSQGTPVAGGSVVFGLEAETDGFDPTVNRWSAGGHTIGRAVFDTLTAYNADGEAEPYLAEEMVPNDDFTEWDIVLPAGVTFHNGDPLDATAVKVNLDAHLASALTAPALRPIDAVEVVDDLTVRVSMNTPWASFMLTLVGQVGAVAAPAQLESGDQQAPIGTGPFMLDSRVVDDSTVVVKNPDYWREGLPYLDQIEFRPIADTDARTSSLRTGDLQVAHTSAPGMITTMSDLADSGDIGYLDDGGIGDENFVTMNLDVEPLDDPDVRLALVQATDPAVYAQVIGEDVQPIARTPFAEELAWHSEEAASAYPGFDLEAAKALVEEWEDENGPLQVTIKHSNRPENRQAAALVQAQWSEAGIDAGLEEFDQATFITEVVSGNYEVAIWRHLPALDPDGERVWWDGENATPPPGIALNYARIRDSEIDDALAVGAGTDDFDTRKAAYDEVQLRLNEILPYIWFTHTTWALGAATGVQNLGGLTLPDGSDALGFYSGRTFMTEVWLDG